MELDAVNPQRLSRAECIELLGSLSIGRIVFTDRALPAVLPVTYAVVDEHLVVRTSEESRLTRSAPGGVVAFEVDDVEPQLHCGWSVTVLGRCERVADEGLAARLRDHVDPWAPGRRDVVLRVPLTLVEGRRVHARLDLPDLQAPVP
jgi:nitroimidazol reductase NimA-like FMN-containing flavoprotein (pyridoxamine 5'-phosphate oxidase superfamily)